MHGIGFDFELQEWFDFKIPKTKITPFYIQDCLKEEELFSLKPNSKVVSICNNPKVEVFTKSKKGMNWEMMNLLFQDKTFSYDITIEKKVGDWLLKMITTTSIANDKLVTFQHIKLDYETQFEDFELFWFSKAMTNFRKYGVLVL